MTGYMLVWVRARRWVQVYVRMRVWECKHVCTWDVIIIIKCHILNQWKVQGFFFPCHFRENFNLFLLGLPSISGINKCQQQHWESTDGMEAYRGLRCVLWRAELYLREVLWGAAERGARRLSRYDRVCGCGCGCGCGVCVCVCVCVWKEKEESVLIFLI